MFSNNAIIRNIKSSILGMGIYLIELQILKMEEKHGLQTKCLSNLFFFSLLQK